MVSMRKVNGVDMVTVEHEGGQGSHEISLAEYRARMLIEKPRKDSKHDPNYKGAIPQVDNGCEAVYNRRTYYQR